MCESDDSMTRNNLLNLRLMTPKPFFRSAGPLAAARRILLAGVSLPVSYTHLTLPTKLEV